MKKILIITLCLVSMTSHAATLILDYPAGLQNGTHRINCYFRYVQGGPSHYNSDGKNTSPMSQYGLPASINSLNSIINNRATTDINLDIQLTCQNNKTIGYHFNNDQLKANGNINLLAPAGC